MQWKKPLKYLKEDIERFLGKFRRLKFKNQIWRSPLKYLKENIGKFFCKFRELEFKEKITSILSFLTFIVSMVTGVAAIYIANIANDISRQSVELSERSVRISELSVRISELSLIEAKKSSMSSDEYGKNDIATKESHNKIDENLNKIVSNLGKATNSLAESTKEIKNISEQQVGIASKLVYFSEQQTNFASQQTGFASQQTDFASQQTDFAKRQVELSEKNTNLAEKTYNISKANLEILPLGSAYLIPQKNIISGRNALSGNILKKYDNEIFLLCDISNNSSLPISVLNIYLKLENESVIERSNSGIMSFIFEGIPAVIKPQDYRNFTDVPLLSESPNVFSIDPFKTYGRALFFFATDFSPSTAELYIETNRGTFTCPINIEEIEEIVEPVEFYFKEKNNIYYSSAKNIPNSVRKYIKEIYSFRFK